MKSKEGRLMTSSLNFDRTFKPDPYVDGVSRVAADGHNGFNELFTSLTVDLDAVRAAFTQAAADLDTVNQRVDDLRQPVPHTLGVAALLMPIDTAPWDLKSKPGQATKPVAPATTATGVVQVPLPGGSRITGFRAQGSNTGSGTLNISLRSQKLEDLNSQEISHITAAGTFGGTTISDEKPVVPDVLIPPGTTCFILAQLTGAVGSDIVTLSGFQVSYTS